MIETGTRTRNNQLTIAAQQGSITRSLSTDPGMSKRVVASLTFGSGQVSGANGTFTAFKGGEVIEVTGVNLNNAFFDVTGIDVANQAFLTLSPPPKTEGPIATILRTA